MAGMVCECFSVPTGESLRKVMHVSKMLGFFGAFGGVDCTHTYWKRCSWNGTNYGREMCTTPFK